VVTVRQRLAIGITIALLAVLPLACAPGGTSSETNRPAVPSVPGSVPRPDHVLLVIFENKSYEQVIGNNAAPYLTSLARIGANFTDAHGERHPSQPNYIALLSGSTYGVTNDSCPRNVGDQPNLARQLLDRGLTFGGFSEDQPGAGFTGCTSSDRKYARKHNPWADFSNVPANLNQPMAALPANFADLPTVSILVPNMCNDMHDCPVAQGNTWAREHLSGYLDWAQTHNSLLIVTFDEDDGSAANHIPTVLLGPMVRPGDTATRIDHYTLLRTLEDMYELTPLANAATTPPITGVWTQASGLSR
jgi:acid phosphatase